MSSADDVLGMSMVRGMKGVGGVCKMCMAWGGVGGEWVRGLGLGFTNPVGTGVVLDVSLCLGCGGVCCVGGEWLDRFDKGMEGCCGVVCVSFDSLYRWQVQVSVYCARGVQRSILLHLIDIFLISCICLWQISQIQTCLCVVVEPGFVST